MLNFQAGIFTIWSGGNSNAQIPVEIALLYMEILIVAIGSILQDSLHIKRGLVQPAKNVFLLETHAHPEAQRNTGISISKTPKDNQNPCSKDHQHER